jgi:hypothetical protein
VNRFDPVVVIFASGVMAAVAIGVATPVTGSRDRSCDLAPWATSWSSAWWRPHAWAVTGQASSCRPVPAGGGRFHTRRCGILQARCESGCRAWWTGVSVVPFPTPSGSWTDSPDRATGRHWGGTDGWVIVVAETMQPATAAVCERPS